MSPESWSIYALIDPDAEAIRYVGRTTTSLAKRLRGHIWAATGKHKQRPCAFWISTLLRGGRQPAIRLLQVGTDINGSGQAEIDWIAKLKSEGIHLLNATEGGDGVNGLDPETKRRLSATRRGRYIGPEWRAKMSASHLGKKMPPPSAERRVQLVAAQLGRKHSPETIAKRAAARRGRKDSAETIAKRILSLRRRECRHGHGPETYHRSAQTGLARCVVCEREKHRGLRTRKRVAKIAMTKNGVAHAA